MNCLKNFTFDTATAEMYENRILFLITSTLEKGESVRISNFGKWNPLFHAGQVKITFSASKKLKDKGRKVISVR